MRKRIAFYEPFYVIQMPFFDTGGETVPRLPLVIAFRLKNAILLPMEEKPIQKTIYWQTIREAWRIARHHKFLWFFGFFAVLMNSALVSGIDSFLNNLSFIQNQGDTLAQAKIFYQSETLSFILNNVSQFWKTVSVANILTLLIVIGIFVFFIWMSVLSQGALITATEKLRRGKMVQPEESFRDGSRTFWPIFWLNILQRAVTTGAAMLIAVPLVSLYLSNGQEIWATILGIITFIILVPFAVVVGFLLQFASAYVALRGRTVGQAIKAAWQLFRQHWLASVEMAIILFLIFTVIIVLFSTLFFPPIVNLFVSDSAGFLSGLGNYINASLVITLIILFLFAGIFWSFQYVATTLFFLKLEEGGVMSRLVRWFGHWGHVGPKTKLVTKKV